MARVFVVLGVLLLSCAGMFARVTLTSSVPLRDQPVALAAGAYGPLFVRFGDDTVGSMRSYTSQKAEVRWRSSWRVKDLAADTNRVCVLTVDDDAFCADGESGRISNRMHEPGALDVSVSLNREVCVVTGEGRVRCAEGRGDALFSKFPPLVRLIDFTACGIDRDARLVCRGNQLTGNYWEDITSVVMEDVVDARLVPNGPAVTGCGLLRSGEVKCFGSNRFGEQGIGKRNGGEKPHVVAGLPRVRRLSHGPGVTCVVGVDGATWCVGAWFGPDYARRAREIPACQRVTKKVVIPACPESGANGDNPCLRAGGRSYEQVVEQVNVVRDAADQCADGESEAYVPTPTLITLFPRARDVLVHHEGVTFLTEDGVLVNTFYGKWTESAL